MHPLLKRILINSVLTGTMLALLGYGLAELARMWLIVQTPARATPGAPPAAVPPDAGYELWRVPFVMAGWGVAFVVVGDILLWVFRKRKPAAPPVPAAPPGPDPAELLLEQLLREAEAKNALTSTPPPAAADNTPVRVPH